MDLTTRRHIDSIIGDLDTLEQDDLFLFELSRTDRYIQEVRERLERGLPNIVFQKGGRPTLICQIDEELISKELLPYFSTGVKRVVDEIFMKCDLMEWRIVKGMNMLYIYGYK